MGYTLLLFTTAAMLAQQLLASNPPIIAQQLLLASTAIGVQLRFPIVTLRILDIFSATRGTDASVHAFFSLLLGAIMMGGLALGAAPAGRSGV